MSHFYQQIQDMIESIYIETNHYLAKYEALQAKHLFASRFCQWLLKENPLDFSNSTFAAYVAQLMREAGTAKETEESGEVNCQKSASWEAPSFLSSCLCVSNMCFFERSWFWFTGAWKLD